MRTCDQIQPLLSAWLDDELSAEDAVDVAAHLAACGECQSCVDGLRELDLHCGHLATRQAATAARIAAAVVSQLASSRSSSPLATHEERTRSEQPERPASSGQSERSEQPCEGGWTDRVRTPLQYLAAAAAGFALAWLVFSIRDARSDRRGERRGDVERPVANQSNSQNSPTDGTANAMANGAATSPRPLDVTLARLTVATGAVTLRQPGQSAWSAAEPQSPYQCSIGTEVRTGPGVRCELETKDRCTIRLNGDTKLTLRSPREVELHAGQIWCRSPDDVVLSVVATTADAKLPANGSNALRFTCPSNGSVVSELDGTGGGRVFTASGEAELSLGGERHRLKPGQVALVAEGRLVIEPYHADSLLATSWMQPLLILKGHDSPELHERIDRMFANLGRSKLDNLYEDEIRSLGEHAVLPLMRYVQSPQSRVEPDRRWRAMSIVSDMAPSWLVGELIELLADDDPPVRVAAARALARLTRQTQDRAPAEWTGTTEELAPTLERWRHWWRENSSRYPSIRPSNTAT